MDILGKQSQFEALYGQASNALSVWLDGRLSCQRSVSSSAKNSPGAPRFQK